MLSEIVIANPSVEVGLATVKQFLRIDYTDDDIMLGYLIKSAREWAEWYCNRSFIIKQHEAYYDKIDKRFMLPRAPISSVTSCKLIYLNQTSTITQNADFYVQGNKDKFVVLTATTYNLPPGFSLNDDLFRFNLDITYQAGYDTQWPDINSNSLIPMAAMEAIMKIVGSSYDMRADVQPTSRQGTIGFIEVPNDSKKLLKTLRRPTI